MLRSCESGDEEDAMDAEQEMFETDLIFRIQKLYCFSILSSLQVHDLDPLGWWRGRQEQYPNLVRLARKFLCVPATSTQAERVFSWMGFLLNKRRLSLSGESVSMQLFLKDNLE